MVHNFPMSAWRTRLLRFGFWGLALTGIAACGLSTPPEAADLLLINGRVYTVDATQPWAETVAIRDGRIQGVGNAADAKRWSGPDTRVVDLRGRLLLPAFGDAHVHPQFGGISHSRCPLHDGKTLQDYQQAIAACVEKTPGTGVVFGVGWSDTLFPPNGIPRKDVLDEVSTTRPLIFKAGDGHSLWLNSKALEVANITRDTPTPPNGSIPRDPETGEPVGALQEASAMALVASLVPLPTPGEREDAIVYTAMHFNSLGITSWHDAGIEFGPDGQSDVLDAYRAVKARDQLTLHVAVAIKWKNESGLEQIPDLVRASERAEEIGLISQSTKIYIDGVIPQQTAYMIAPYEHSGSERGQAQIKGDVFKAAVIDLDRRGFQVFVHAIGDGGVRAALDAFAVARQANGPDGGRHMIAHLNVVDPADQPRFGELAVTAQFQPLWATHNDYMDLTREAIGATRSAYIYPAGSILKSGGRLAYGADWPVASADPLQGLQVAVTRTDIDDPASGPLLPGESVTLEQAIRAYTIDVAYVNRMDDTTGSITVGKQADLVVLDRDVFEIPVTEIGKTKVLLTLFEGRPVFGDLERLSR